LPVTDRNSQRVCSLPRERGLGTRRGGARQRHAGSAHDTPAIREDSIGQAIICSCCRKCGGSRQLHPLSWTCTHHWKFVCTRGTPNSDDHISICVKLPVTDRNSQRVCSRSGERGLGTRRGWARQGHTGSAHDTPAVGEDSIGQSIVCSCSRKCGGGRQCDRLSWTDTHRWRFVCGRGTPNGDDDISTCGKLPVTDSLPHCPTRRSSDRGLGTRRGGARQGHTVSAHHNPAVGQDSTREAIVCSCGGKCGGGRQCDRLSWTDTYRWRFVCRRGTSNG